MKHDYLKNTCLCLVINDVQSKYADKMSNFTCIL